MRKSKLIIALVAAGFALATTNVAAQGTGSGSPAKNQDQLGEQGHFSKDTHLRSATPGAPNLKASSIIGLTVRNESGERLGKVQDLVVSLSTCSAPYAIVGYGGALGIGTTRVAVPLADLKWSGESKELMLPATKAEFESADAAPTGGWNAVGGEDWMKSVDRFYGHPSISGQSRFERQEATGMGEGREPVRDAADQKGATDLLNQPPAVSADSTNMIHGLTKDYVADKVNSTVRQIAGPKANDIQVTVKNGKVILQGKVSSETQKEALERQIKTVPGVDQVENQLEVTQSE